MVGRSVGALGRALSCLLGLLMLGAGARQLNAQATEHLPDGSTTARLVPKRSVLARTPGQRAALVLLCWATLPSPVSAVTLNEHEPIWDEGNVGSAFDPAQRRGTQPAVGGPPAPLRQTSIALQDQSPAPAADAGAGSGNFQLTVPMVRLPGRGLDLALDLTYNSRLWHAPGNGAIYYDPDADWPAPGWSLGLGRMVSVGSQMMLVDGDGTRRPFKWDRLERLVFSPHPVVDRNHYHTTDGSLVDYSVDTVQGVGFVRGQARYPNGTVVDFAVKGRQPPDDPLRHHVLHASRITDANGNRISITYRGNTGPAIDTITDTLGRVLTFHYGHDNDPKNPPDEPNGLLTAITGPGLSGGSRSFVRLHYARRQIPGSLTDCCLFSLNQQVRDPATGQLTNGAVSLWLVDAVVFPGTRTGYWFGDEGSYSAYGMIRKVSERRGMGLAAGSLTEQGTVTTPGLTTRERVYNYPLQPIRPPDAPPSDAPTYTEVREWWHRMDPTGRECAEAPDRHCAVTTYRVVQNANNPRRLTVTRPDGTSDVQLTSFDDGLPLQHDVFGSDAVWVEDDLPAGARPQAWGDGWRWVTADPAPFSGARAHQSALQAGMHQHFFEDATAALPVAAGDRLFAYVHLDPANPPEQVMLQWNPGDGTGWEHRAYWGADRIGWGVNGTESRRGMGALPAAGRWVRLEVAARDVGLEGKRVTGMAFTLFGGRATWDRAGRTPLLRSTATSWAKGAYDSWRRTRVAVTDEAGQTTATDFLYGPSHNQVAEVTERDYGGTAALRRTRTEYVADEGYLKRHIFNLPKAVEVYEGASTVPSSRTEYTYDGQRGGQLANAPGVVMHDPASDPYAENGGTRVQRWGDPVLGDVPVPGDYDGDGKTDLAVWQPSSGEWRIVNSSGGPPTFEPWGSQAEGDRPVPGNYDGSGNADLAVWRSRNGEWWITRSAGGHRVQQWGSQPHGDVPVPGHYEGPLAMNLAVWRASTGTWWVLRSDGSHWTQQWGSQALGDVPVPGDYDGDRKTDFAVWRASTGEWWILASSGGQRVQRWGSQAEGDRPVPGDYDGDGKTDLAVWRAPAGEWWILASSGGQRVQRWGSQAEGDRPVPGDYDGDGKTDLAVWRAPAGEWRIVTSSGYRPETDLRGNLARVTAYADPATRAGAVTEARRYDIAGNLVEASTAACPRAMFEYTAATQYAYPTARGCGAADPASPVRTTTRASYDFSTGLVLAATDPNGRTTGVSYLEDSLRPARVTWPTGARTEYAYDDPNLAAMESAFDAADPTNQTGSRVVTRLNGLGLVRRVDSRPAGGACGLAEDAPGQRCETVRTRHDALGRPTGRTRPYWTGEAPRWSETSYDPLGRVTRARAPDGSETRWFHNEAARPSVVPAEAGLRVRRVDPWGRELWTLTNALGQLKYVVEPNPGGGGYVLEPGALQTLYRYNAFDQLTGVLRQQQNRSFRYDGLGRLTHQAVSEGLPTLDDAGAYVGAGGGKWTDVFAYDERSNLVSRTDARGAVTRLAYAGVGAAETPWVEDDLPAGARPQAWEDGWRWVTADPAPFAGARAHQSTLASGMHQHFFEDATAALPVAAGDRLFAYVHLDPANPPEQVMLQWNPGDGTGWEHRAYWGADRIGWGVNGTESRRGMGALPAAGRWVRLEVAARDVGLEGKRVTGMAFTLFGGRATWDRAGRTAADPLNRLRQVSHDTANVGDRSSPVLPAPTVGFEYVPTGDVTRPSRVTTAGVGAEEFRYDTEGRPGSKILTLQARPAQPLATDYLHDGLHRPTGIRYPAEYGITGNPRRLARLGYLAGRPIRLSVDGTAYVGNVDYDAAGQPLSLALPGMRQEYGYDAATGLVSGQRVLRGATRLLDLAYDYLRPGADGRTGQLTGEVNNLDRPRSRAYEYDALGRLTRATGGEPDARLWWEQQYSYDGLGNRTGVWASGEMPGEVPVPRDGLAALTYDSRNRITTPGFAYDAAGNLVRAQRPDGAWQRYRYDAAGRLAQVLTDAGTAVETYTYGPDRRRLVTTHASGERTYYAWAGDTLLAEYREAGGSTTPRWRKSYFHFGGRLLATASLEGTSRVVRHHHPDRLGTRLVTDQAGNVVAEQETLPFGTALTPGPSGVSPLFTSYERSAATGLDYAVNRFYDPALGRFTTVDPLGLGTVSPEDPCSTNMYAYVGNDPLNAVDPLGLRCVVTCDMMVEVGPGSGDSAKITQERCSTRCVPDDEPGGPGIGVLTGGGGGGGRGGRGDPEGGAARPISLQEALYRGLGGRDPSFVPGPRPTTQLDILAVGYLAQIAAIFTAGAGLELSSSIVLKSGMTLPQALAGSGNLSRVLPAMAREFAATNPQNAIQALNVVGRAAGSVGLGLGTATTTAGGSIAIAHAGGVVTTIASSGAIIVTRGASILLRLTPK